MFDLEIQFDISLKCGVKGKYTEPHKDLYVLSISCLCRWKLYGMNGTELICC